MTNLQALKLIRTIIGCMDPEESWEKLSHDNPGLLKGTLPKLPFERAECLRIQLLLDLKAKLTLAGINEQ